MAAQHRREQAMDTLVLSLKQILPSLPAIFLITPIDVMLSPTGTLGAGIGLNGNQLNVAVAITRRFAKRDRVFHTRGSDDVVRSFISLPRIASRSLPSAKAELRKTGLNSPNGLPGLIAHHILLPRECLRLVPAAKEHQRVGAGSFWAYEEDRTSFIGVKRRRLDLVQYLRLHRLALNEAGYA
jgi:hypothetical protein